MLLALKCWLQGVHKASVVVYTGEYCGLVDPFCLLWKVCRHDELRPRSRVCPGYGSMQGQRWGRSPGIEPSPGSRPVFAGQFMGKATGPVDVLKHPRGRVESRGVEGTGGREGGGPLNYTLWPYSPDHIYWKLSKNKWLKIIIWKV